MPRSWKTGDCATTERQVMAYGINSGFARIHDCSSWFLWPMFSFQVYSGTVLNT